MRHPDEVEEVGLGGEEVGDDDRGKNLTAKRLRDFGLLRPLAALVVLVIRLERRFLLRGLKMELESLEEGRTGTSVIAVETDEEI